MIASKNEEMNIAATNLFIANADQQEIWRAQAREDYELHERQREFMIAKVMREKEEAEQQVADLLRENELLKKKLLEAESH